MELKAPQSVNQALLLVGIHGHGEPRRPWEGPNDGKAGKGGGNCGAVVELKKTTLGRGRGAAGTEGDDDGVVEEDDHGA